MSLDELIPGDDSSARCWCGECVSKGAHFCPSCETPYHGECWDFIEGCATYGCEARGKALDELALEFEIPDVSDSEIVIRDDRAVAKSDHIGARLLSRYSAVRRRFGLRDDSWIDGYLDEVRASLQGIRFTPVSGRALPSGMAFVYCRNSGSKMVSAEEDAFARVLDNAPEWCYSFTSTFAFGFLQGGKSLVAYDECYGADWLYLMGKRNKPLGEDDQVVARALLNAQSNDRVVPADKESHVRLSCVPGADRRSAYDRDARARSILGQAVQPHGLWLYRRYKVKELTLCSIAGSAIESLSDGQVWVRPVGLGGDTATVISLNAYGVFDLSIMDRPVRGLISSRKGAESDSYE